MYKINRKTTNYCNKQPSVQLFTSAIKDHIIVVLLPNETSYTVNLKKQTVSKNINFINNFTSVNNKHQFGFIGFTNQVFLKLKMNDSKTENKLKVEGSKLINSNTILLR